MKIAVIGGGVAGLTSAYMLHKEHDITLFEKSHRVGGNAYTIKTREGFSTDIGASLFSNYSTSNFSRLLKELNVKIAPSADAGLCFYNLITKKFIKLNTTIKGLSEVNFIGLCPSNIRTLYRLVKAGNIAIKKHLGDELTRLSFSQLLDSVPQFKGMPSKLLTLYLCMLSSMSQEEVLDAPADFFIEKLLVHNLRSVNGIKQLFCMHTNTQSYVNALIEGFKNKIIYSANILKVSRGNSIQIHLNDGVMEFDKVIFACNSDQALALIEKPTPTEERLLGVTKYKDGQMIVHTDTRRFPARKFLGGYTFLYTDTGTSINGCTWYLPGVPDHSKYICSQHPNFDIDSSKVEFETVFRTPIYTFSSYSAMKELGRLNGVNNTYFCGSYFGYGLHEDAVTSAIEVVENILRGEIYR